MPAAAPARSRWAAREDAARDRIGQGLPCGGAPGAGLAVGVEV
jgi:hypothetical protein